jgi:hypothetical protein
MPRPAKTLSERLKAVKPLPQCPLKLRPELLLSPNIPQPMHGMAPREILGRKWWDATRKAAYRATAFHCLACGVHKAAAEYHRWLEGHEVYSIDYVLGRMIYLETVSLCHFCHNSIHDGRLKVLLEKSEIHHAKYAAIIQHRDTVLARAGLIRSVPYNGPVADWSDWRLVLNEIEYPPLFKSFKAWQKAMK